jgi:hypothetical protein
VESQHVAFIALASAAILPYDQVKAYAELPGGSESDQPFPSREEIARRLQDAGASGSDPKPYLEQLRIPALWLDGTADWEVTGDQSIALLNTVKAPGGGGFCGLCRPLQLPWRPRRASRRAVAVPNWVENDQERSVDLAGDRLTLCASPLLVVG